MTFKIGDLVVINPRYPENTERALEANNLQKDKIYTVTYGLYETNLIKIDNRTGGNVADRFMLIPQVDVGDLEDDF